MKDEDRLNLLKEVAGTTVYEERRSESIRIMQETSNKQEQIMVSQVVECMHSRLPASLFFRESFYVLTEELR